MKYSPTPPRHSPTSFLVLPFCRGCMPFSCVDLVKIKSMETDNKENTPNTYRDGRSDNRSGRVWAGLIIVAIGTLFLVDRMGIDIPSWIFTGPTILIGIGVYVGARKSFKPGGWLIAVAIGIFLLLDDYIYDFELRQYLWPVIIIGVGLYIIFRPKKNNQGWDSFAATESLPDGQWESISIFGSNKNIISKDFKGGEMVTIFGGSELNLTQADISGMVTLEVVQIFGGTKLIIPANWKVHTAELVSIFGGIEDKRPLSKESTDSDKVLNLKGVSVFGGIDIRSY